MSDIIQYEVGYIKQLEKIIDIPELSEEVIQIINDLAKKVGAPSYNKTPVFKKRSRQIRKKDNVITQQEWENIRNFKLTKLDKNEEGFVCIIDNIRSNLNKLTNDNFAEINDNIKKIIIKQINKEDNTEENLNEIAKSIFEIGSLNIFWSNLYAKLYKNLIQEFHIMKRTCLINFNNFMDVFEDLNEIEETLNYNLLCENNKKNENRKGRSSFFVNLMLYDIIEMDVMYDFLFNLIKKMEELDMEKKEEFFENISIIILAGKDKFEENEEKWQDVIRNMTIISKSSLTKKMLFKCLDVLEEIED
ncbi:MAG: hypothetical protein CXT73_07275 [Methanobacteriota archaeon]|nr:MAG: hypothetical protein CXT73_07275 [Euryarchaeota archaeon]